MKHTDLILNKPARDLFPRTFLLALQSSHEDPAATRGLHVKRAIHIGIARLAVKLRASGSLCSANGSSIIDQRRCLVLVIRHAECVERTRPDMVSIVDRGSPGGGLTFRRVENSWTAYKDDRKINRFGRKFVLFVICRREVIREIGGNNSYAIRREESGGVLVRGSSPVPTTENRARLAKRSKERKRGFTRGCQLVHIDSPQAQRIKLKVWSRN